MGMTTTRTVWWVVNTKFEEAFPVVDPWGDWTLHAEEHEGLVGRNGLQRRRIPEQKDVTCVKRWSWHV